MIAGENNLTPKSRPQSRSRWLAILGAVGGSFVACLLFGGWLMWNVIALRPFQVKGEAMLPTIADGDRVFIDGRTTEFERGDVIVFRYPLDAGSDNPRYFLKRIVGLPGDTFQIDEACQISINKETLDEPYLSSEMQPKSCGELFQRLSDNEYFVMGIIAQIHPTVGRMDQWRKI